MRMQIYFGPRNTFSKSNFKIVFRIGVFVYTMSRFLCQLSHIEDDFSKCQNTEITKYCTVISGLCFSNWFAAVGGGGLMQNEYKHKYIAAVLWNTNINMNS